MPEFDFGVIVSALPFLWKGMQLSLLLTGLAMSGGIMFGTLLALMRLSRFRPLRLVGGTYVNMFRATPLILVIFWFYFLVPLAVGRPVGAFYSALIAFALFEAAYYCEIIRAGIQSVPRGQMAAAQAMGLSYRQAMQYVILPQAFRHMVPILLTQAIILFQDTSLVYVLSLQDFMTAASIVATREGRLIEMYLFAALIYFALCYLASLFVKRLQKTIAV